MHGFVRVAAGVTSPAEFFSEENVGLILARGRQAVSWVAERWVARGKQRPDHPDGSGS
jgi:hypothetical protein